jgi:hypothetical protein
MSDIRCPMCGKPNPVEAEVCQYCQARLKPLVAPPTPEEVPEQSGPESAQQGSSSHEKAGSDWLESLRSSGGEMESDSDFEEDENEWLQEPGEERAPEPAAGGQELDDDWLSDLRREGDLESGATAPDEDQDDEQGDEGDWIPPFDRDGEKGLPEWLSEPESEESQAELPSEEPPVFEESTPEEAGEEDEPEWLRRIRARQGDEESGEAAPSEAEPEDQWSRWRPEEPEAEPQEEIPLPDEEGLPQWISETGQVEGPSDEEEEGEALPDWLTEEGAESPEEQQPSEQEIPDWLPEFEEAEQPEAPGESPEGEIPDWLSEIEQVGEEGAEEEEGERPAWPSGKEIGKPQPEAQEREPEEPEEADELPDWVLEMEASKPVLDVPEPPPEEEEEPAEVSFDWLEGELEDEIQEGEQVEQPFEEVESEPPFVTEDEPIESEGLPEWLSEAASQEQAFKEEEAGREAEGEQGEEDLERAELPGWLEAMRPVEAVAPETPLEDERGDVVETSGPLAGLQGVIPAEPGVARGKKPASYSIKLQVSENQQAHAGALQDLVESEGIPKPIPSGPAISSLFFLRVGIFILLLLAVFWPVLTGSQSAPLPAFSRGAFDTDNVIEQMASSSPVLFAVDYNPALSGEMEAAAGGVLDHLMVKGAYLALVSTNPSGPAQAERLVMTINAMGEHHYQGIHEYANLGYIPGGQTGLFSFAQTPRRALPFDLAGNQVWQETPLQNVQSLSDFGLAVVVTENPDTARAWIEQVRTQLGQTPLVMVVSAQAEPMVRPYYAGTPQQVQGFVVGLNGGASYEGLISRNLLARKYWDSFSLGILVAAVLILIGAGFSLFSTLLSGGESKSGGGLS